MILVTSRNLAIDVSDGAILELESGAPDFSWCIRSHLLTLRRELKSTRLGSTTYVNMTINQLTARVC
jgi:hypothetical protein